MKRTYSAEVVLVAVLGLMLVQCAAPPTLLSGTYEPELVVTCTLIGCSDALIITFKEEIQSGYLVEVSDDQDRRVIVEHQVGLSEEELAAWVNRPSATSGHDVISLSSPEATKFKEETSALGLCSSTNGFMSVGFTQDHRSDPPLITRQFVIQCFGTVPEAVLQSYLDEATIALYHFTPPQVTIRARVGEITQTDTFQPEYAIHQPNGPNCAPECRTGNITIHLQPVDPRPK